MKKLILTIMILNLFICPVLAKPDWTDEEEISVQGQRPKIDIEVSEVTVTILAEEFVDGRVEKEVTIYNEGNISTVITTLLKDVPIDLHVIAEVENDILQKGESTILHIIVELSEQQEEEDFVFTILVQAERK